MTDILAVQNPLTLKLALFVGAVRLDSEHPRAIARAAREYAPAGV